MKTKLHLINTVKIRKTAYLSHLMRLSEYNLLQFVLEGKTDCIGRKVNHDFKNGQRTLFHIAKSRDGYAVKVTNLDRDGTQTLQFRTSYLLPVSYYIGSNFISPTNGRQRNIAGQLRYDDLWFLFLLQRLLLRNTIRTVVGTTTDNQVWMNKFISFLRQHMSTYIQLII